MAKIQEKIKIMKTGKTPKERLLDFILYKHLTVRSFEKACGLGNAYIQNMTFTPSKKKLEAIREIFPELNPEWVTEGIGEMLIDAEASIIQRKDEQIASLKNLLKTQDELIEAKEGLIKALRECNRLLKEESAKKGCGSTVPEPESTKE